MKKLAKISGLVAVVIVLLGGLGLYAEIELLSDALLPGLLANAALASKGRFGLDGIWGLLIGYGVAFITWFGFIFLLSATCRLGCDYIHKHPDETKA